MGLNPLLLALTVFFPASLIFERKAGAYPSEISQISTETSVSPSWSLTIAFIIKYWTSRKKIEGTNTLIIFLFSNKDKR